jgi:hypothetical protein
MHTIEVVDRFAFLSKEQRWSDASELSNDDVGVLFSVVTLAGFEPKAVVHGRLRGEYRDQDGATGETYPINATCPYKVINQEGRDHFHATGWLDRVLILSMRTPSPQDAVQLICREIERSVPLKPIRLTSDGDMLREYPPSREYLVDHTRDTSKLPSCVGVHVYCNGWMDRMRATETHDVIVCRQCHLRVPFVKEIETYGELRKHLES